MPRHTMQYDAMPPQTKSFNAMQRHAKPCNAMLCHGSHAMPCNAMPCNAMQCHVTPYQTMQYSPKHPSTIDLGCTKIVFTFTFTSAATSASPSSCHLQQSSPRWPSHHGQHMVYQSLQVRVALERCHLRWHSGLQAWPDSYDSYIVCGWLLTQLLPSPFPLPCSTSWWRSRWGTGNRCLVQKKVRFRETNNLQAVSPFRCPNFGCGTEN